MTSFMQMCLTQALSVISGSIQMVGRFPPEMCLTPHQLNERNQIIQFVYRDPLSLIKIKLKIGKGS